MSEFQLGSRVRLAEVRAEDHEGLDVGETGVVTDIDVEDTIYPITVLFDNGVEDYFADDGQLVAEED